MVRIGNFFFRFRNALFPLAALLVVVPAPQVLPSDGWALLLGGAVILLGQALRVATIGLAYIVRGGRNRRVYAQDLVTEGLFTHCRNPLYLGNLLMLIGFGLAMNSWVLLGLGGPLFVFIYQAIVRAEEAYLGGRFGEAYAQYCRDTPRWWPRWPGLRATLRSMQFDWRRVIVKEYGTFFNWLAGLPIALYLRQHLFRWHDFAWQPLDGVLACWLAIAAVLYLVVRFLKKTNRLEPLTPGT